MNNSIELVTAEAGIVEVDHVQDKIGSVFISEQDKKDPDTGMVTHGPEELIGQKVRFKEAFGERILIDGRPHIWFSDLKHSLYYILTE